ncbi:restriction endonuclease subunit S [Chromobacterium vaccinii]|uniref:restriction endonuclease subunit S n=1 Tax=Chromobacterium vaccinii TaxID=1108595 RepID=UPI0031E17D9F
MSSEWKVYTVEDLVLQGVIAPPLDGNHGAIHPKSSDFVTSGVPFIMASDMKDGQVDTINCAFITPEQAATLRKGFAKSGDVLLSHKATIGRTALIGNVSFDVLVLTPQVTYYRVLKLKELNNRYLKYYFDSEPFQQTLAAWAGAGSTRAYLGITAQRKLPVVIPPIEIQEAIAEAVGALDDRISLLRETNATLEAIAQALFKSWFVDFDPVRAKMEGRAPEGMDEAMATLFPDGLEESELGLVPRGWSSQSVYDVSKVIYGAPFASKRFNTEQVGSPLIRIRDLKDENPGVFTDEVHPKGYMTQPGDIVVGMDGEFRAYIWGGKPAWLNQRVCVFQPLPGISHAFVLFSIRPLLAAVEASETATTVIHLGKNDIDRFRVLRPANEVLNAFNDVVRPLYLQIVQGKQMAANLAALRDTLLPRLISGQLRLPEAEALIA